MNEIQRTTSNKITIDSIHVIFSKPMEIRFSISIKLRIVLSVN